MASTAAATPATPSAAADELRLLLRTPPPSSSSDAAPPPPANEAAIAHAALQSLRDSGDPSFLFLRSLLEILPSVGSGGAGAGLRGDEEALMFHCATGLRSVLLRRWDAEYGAEFRACVRDWSLCAGLGLLLMPPGAGAADAGAGAGGAAGLTRTVSMALLGLAAGAWKRGWADGGGSPSEPARSGAQQAGNAEAQAHLVRMMLSQGGVHRPGTPRELLQMLEALLLKPLSEAPSAASSGDVSVASRSAAFLACLLGEFSGTGSGGFGGYNMPLEFHASVRSDLESESGALDEVMKVGMGALGGVVRLWTEGLGGGGSGSAPPVVRDAGMVELSSAVVSLNCDVLGWEFNASGRSAWEVVAASGSAGGKSALVRPPERWRDALVRPDFLGAVFAVYGSVRSSPEQPQVVRGMDQLAHGVRQLLLLLSSVTGNVFADAGQRLAYASFLVDGCLAAMGRLHEENQRRVQANQDEDDEAVGAETVDLCAMLARLVANFRVKGLSKLPSFPTLLGAVAAVGADLLRRNEAECERARGDPDLWTDANGRRDEALGQLLDAAVLLADDPWLWGVCGSPSEAEEARAAGAALARNLAPLYRSYVSTRTNMAKMEEHFLASQARELDEVREEITGSAAEEETASASSLGRLDVAGSASCLNGLFGQCLPQFQALISDSSGAGAAGGEVTPDAAALLEEVRLLVSCATHVLTDECEGETPMAPEAVERACASDPNACAAVAGLMQSLVGLAEFQASQVVARPSDPRLSPFLARTVLRFVRRWAPAYVLPEPSRYSDAGAGGGTAPGGILATWADPEAASWAVDFCATLCLHYQVAWPQEGAVQEEAAGLLLALARRGRVVRDVLVRCPSFGRIAALHSATSGLRHNASEAEVRQAAAAAAAGTAADGGAAAAPTEEMVRGYRRLPYADRARVLTSLLVGSSEPGDDDARSMVDGCLRAVHAPFASLVGALESGSVSPHDADARETACLCVDLYGGAARSSEMAEPGRIPAFVTPSLGPLAGLMRYYASDLTLCERLLGMFRDYAEQFVAVLDGDQCLALFRSSAELLKAYSAHHCAASRVKSLPKSSLEADQEEEQSYNDVLCAIQLLIHLGTKDFVDVCSAPGGDAAAGNGGGAGSGVDSGQVTDVIFFGLQQILPLMTQGLLQFPNLCTQFFSLVGFMMDTYTEKVCGLPYDLLGSLLDSLLFGMSHADPFVSKSSLRGVGGLAREHLRGRSLDVHLSAHPDLLDDCSRRLLSEVVFQNAVWDRLEPAGMALLPLVAADVGRFAAVVASIEPRFGDEARRGRVRAAFERLLRPEVLSKVASGGYEGRMNRLKFKKDFEVFVKDVHSFLVIH